MSGSMEKSALRVEGEDDKQMILHLLRRHGVNLDEKPMASALPEIKPTHGVGELLKTMDSHIKGSVDRVIGFVLDGDIDPQKQWSKIAKCLLGFGVEVDSIPRIGGFRTRIEELNATVGVWLMPDNASPGVLEDFLRRIIDVDNRLIGFAEHASDEARASHGALFPTAARTKAVIRTWLAWQEEPGHPYGRALAKRYFNSDSDLALQFVTWFKELYGISERISE